MLNPRLFVDRRVVPVGPDPLLSDDRRVRAGLLPFTRAQRVDLHLGLNKGSNRKL